ncbi:hypothetical protein T492DRAFT_911234 [Pavlovales sp. CCMP2436]|nr:hypothetical protein T492DRAFT_911234 [Pavlovales sp. CCMP2436]
MLAQELRLWRSLLGFEDEGQPGGDPALPLGSSALLSVLEGGELQAAGASPAEPAAAPALTNARAKPPAARVKPPALVRAFSARTSTEREGAGARARAVVAGQAEEAAVTLEALPLIVLGEREDAQRTAKSSLLLAKAARHWAAARTHQAEAEADAALCGGGNGRVSFGAVGVRGSAFVGALELVRDALAASSGKLVEMHAWMGADFARVLAAMGSAVQALGDALARALQIAAAEMTHACCNPFRAAGRHAPSGGGGAAADVERASALVRAQRAALAQLYHREIVDVIQGGRQSLARRVSVVDVLLHNSAIDAVLYAADELLALTLEVENACARAAAQSGDSAYGLARASDDVVVTVYS